MGLPKTITSNPAQGVANLSGGNKAQFSDQLLEKAPVNIDTALKDLESRLRGLGAAEVEARIKRDGLNRIAREKCPSPLKRPGFIAGLANEDGGEQNTLIDTESKTKDSSKEM